MILNSTDMIMEKVKRVGQEIVDSIEKNKITTEQQYLDTISNYSGKVVVISNSYTILKEINKDKFIHKEVDGSNLSLNQFLDLMAVEVIKRTLKNAIEKYFQSQYNNSLITLLGNFKICKCCGETIKGEHRSFGKVHFCSACLETLPEIIIMNYEKYKDTIERIEEISNKCLVLLNNNTLYIDNGVEEILLRENGNINDFNLVSKSLQISTEA